jgi:aldehyde:ferredoxin oxidoreductase
MFGYSGNYLLVDLESEGCERRTLSHQEARSFLGGSGLATRWLLRHSAAGVDPFGPDNPLVFAACPLVDSGVTTTARAALAARSPQTGLLGESLLSSRFAIGLKRTGWDGVVVRGCCDRLSILVVGPTGSHLVPAPELAGLSAADTEAALTSDPGRLELEAATAFHVAAIGPAGEHRVRYATISHDGRHAGRTGLGAVMGAKQLKAVVVWGSRRPRAAQPELLARIAERLRDRSLGPETAKYRLVGTAANLLTFDRMGVLPTRNFQRATFPAAGALSGEALAGGDRLRERTGCAGCTIGCEHRFVPAGGGGAVRAEYESLFALGPLLGLDDPDMVLEAVRRCDAAGLDTLSLGGTLAWAIETSERGLLPHAIGSLRFGRAEGVLDLIPRIARRGDPLADLLAEGTRAAAARVGAGSDAWAMHVKGLELPGYDPRGLKTLALGLAVGARGACHNRSGAYEVDFGLGSDRLRAVPGRAAAAAESEDRAAVMDALVICKFLRHCFDDFYAESAELLGAVTGWDLTGEELRRAGARIVTLKRLYNQREGAYRSHDTLPPRLFDEAVPDGPGAGSQLTRADLDAMLDAYYRVRGWHSDGRVPAEQQAAVLG